MSKIQVTISIQTLGELVSGYNRHAKGPLGAVVAAVRDMEWCIQIVGHEGAIEEVTTERQLAKVLRRCSKEPLDQTIARAIAQKKN